MVLRSNRWAYGEFKSQELLKPIIPFQIYTFSCPDHSNTWIPQHSQLQAGKSTFFYIIITCLLFCKTATPHIKKLQFFKVLRLYSVMTGLSLFTPTFAH